MVKLNKSLGYILFATFLNLYFRNQLVYTCVDYMSFIDKLHMYVRMQVVCMYLYANYIFHSTVLNTCNCKDNLVKKFLT